MRKILSLLLCVAMLCSLVVVSAQADEEVPGAALQIASVATLKGTTVEIDVGISNNPGLATFQLIIADTNGLGATFDFADNDDSLSLTKNNAQATYWWSGAYDDTTSTLGTLKITIPDGAGYGTYTFTATTNLITNTANEAVPVSGTTFTITVAEKAITGVNLGINAGIAIGVHVLFEAGGNPAGTSITAVNVDGKEYTTVAECEEGDLEDEYVYYIDVTPWTADVDFLVDFTDNFEIDGENKLDLKQLPATAKTTGVLSYCNAILATSPTSKLKKVLADLLEYCRQVQIYKGGEATFTLPTGLKATTIDYETLTGYCDDEEVAAQDLTTGKASGAAFDDVVITFGAGVVATFNIHVATAAELEYDLEDEDEAAEYQDFLDGLSLNMRVGGTSGKVYPIDGRAFSYSFNPSQCTLDATAVSFELYVKDEIKAANRTYTNKYNPLNYVSYLMANKKVDDAEDILTVLAAYYNYGASVDAYN